MTDRTGCPECAELRRRIAALERHDAPPDVRRMIAEELFLFTFGGTSDPTLTEMAESLACHQADAILAAFARAGFKVVKRDVP